MQVYFLAYCIFMRNKPYVLPALSLPAFIYGILWSVGMFSWFVSSEKLSQAVSFPISTRVGCLYKREAKRKCISAAGSHRRPLGCLLLQGDRGEWARSRNLLSQCQSFYRVSETYP